MKIAIIGMDNAAKRNYFHGLFTPCLAAEKAGNASSMSIYRRLPKWPKRKKTMKSLISIVEGTLKNFQQHG
jgi:hypothetical protein